MKNTSKDSQRQANHCPLVSRPIPRRLGCLILSGCLPLLLGAECGLETCDIFNCDTLSFIEELLAPDEHAEGMHDDTMDGMIDEDDEHMADEEDMHDEEEDHDEATDEPDEGLQDEEQDEHGEEDAEHDEGAEDHGEEQGVDDDQDEHGEADTP